MRLLKNKNMQDLEQSVIKNSQETKLYKATQQKGSTVRLLLNIINNEIVELYKYTDERQETCFLSTAENEEIDELAELINCKRNGLNDKDYKNKISNYITILEKANITSVFWSARLPGIDDMTFNQNSIGANSFTVIPYSSMPLISENYLNDIKHEISEVVAYGTRFQVINPILLRTKIKIKPVYYQRYINYHIDEDGMNVIVYNNMVKYLGSLKAGMPFDKSMFLKLMREDDNGIFIHLKDVIITELTIGNQQIKGDYYSPGWNQRIIENEMQNSIIVE